MSNVSILHRCSCALVLLTAAFFGFMGTASAAVSPWHDNAFTSVRLVAAQSGVGGADDESPLRFGLEFRMAENWKIYWRSPGDAGYPPTIDWNRSLNVASANLAWPAPMRFSVLGLETFGYEKTVIFPLMVVPVESGKAVRLSASIDYLTCSDICVPEQASVSLDLPAVGGGITDNAHDISRFVAQVPRDGAAHGLRIGNPVFAPGDPPNLLVVAQRVSGLLFKQPDLYVEGPERLSFGKPLVSLHDGGRAATFRVPVFAAKQDDLALTGEAVTLTLVDGMRNAEATLDIRAATSADSTISGGFSLTILAIAFLGGLILNLMPCVLPVLGMKLAGLVNTPGAGRAAIRRGFLATAAGIIFAFVLLAVALAGLKLGGATIGWGIQFQQPVFLAFMAVVVTVFACNLWGLFDIRLPAFASMLGGLPKSGGETSLFGHFVTGIFATLLATPCSAPFLGTAVGFALARGWQEMIVIFIAIGIGLATPYLTVAGIPGLAGLLPKPGRWMMPFRRLLALALAGTAVWLLSVMMASVGVTITLVIGSVLTVAVALIALRCVAARPQALSGLATALLVAAIGLAVWDSGDGADTASKTDDSGLWQPFAPRAIAGLVAAGHTVIVDVTADWCLTCKVNKSVAFGNPDVERALDRRSVTSMVADWTLPDPAVTAYLVSFERYGIPFNAVYGPGAPDGIVLPELLRPGDILDALDRADGIADRPVSETRNTI